jgi:hypothetical protein
MQESLQEDQFAAIMRHVKDLVVGPRLVTIFINPKNQEKTMKTMKAICTAAILALVLTVPAYAGEINSPGVTCEGEIDCPGGDPGDIHTPGATSSIAGDISTPGFMNIMLTVLTLM